MFVGGCGYACRWKVVMLVGGQAVMLVGSQVVMLAGGQWLFMFVGGYARRWSVTILIGNCLPVVRWLCLQVVGLSC